MAKGTKKTGTTKGKKTHSLFKKASTQKAFLVNDGTSLRSLPELAAHLEQMEDHVFNHHVADGRHDFAAWTEDVFKGDSVASEMRAVSGKYETQRVLLKHLFSAAQQSDKGRQTTL